MNLREVGSTEGRQMQLA